MLAPLLRLKSGLTRPLVLVPHVLFLWALAPLPHVLLLVQGLFGRNLVQESVKMVAVVSQGQGLVLMD